MCFFNLYLYQMSFLHPVHYLLNEYFGQRKYTKLYYPLYICCTMFILSLMTVTRGGDALISLLDDIGAAMGILMITISEAVFVFAIYGLNEFFADLAFMTDNPPTMIMKIFFVAGPIIIIHILLASFFHWNPPTFQNVTYPITFYSLAWVLADITFNIRGAFEPTENWVPDLMYSLQNKSLRNMMNTRNHDKVKEDDPIIFEFGKPKMSMRFDIATQTNDSGIDDDHISDKRFQHLYLDFVKHFYNTDYELIRRYNETEVLSWNSLENMEFLLSYGVLEKSVQTELESK
ncbi:uncharacterized protein LOC126898013 [Daktulosphaira vitifoliae]|uniref:uncharacterized protein LOC126898013 n=1 Tax=Daktulosphaira vitifoliae TaxID=58002 RepID=UPI0021AA36D4|nr:uncharacterized protein LOC126898013 [Daktulosphaira vitifoliae]